MSEIIYILTNESMQGYIKIGFTNNSVEERLKQLDRTNIPLPFEIYYACEVENAREDERWLHNIFSDKRVRDGREFFRMNPERVVIALKRIQKKDITPTSLSTATKAEQKEIGEKKKKRACFDFKTYGISTGSEIYFSRDESIKAKVLPNNLIKFRGEKISTSESARKLLGYPKPPAGTLYWMYENETLDERRRRMDNEKID